MNLRKVLKKNPAVFLGAVVALTGAFFLFRSSSLLLPPPTVDGDVMNGYSLRQVGDFAAQWHLVTVRYRRDTGEMRFTYANDLAWNTLMAGKADYPDGAIFGKIAVMTGSDPGFESSAVPNGNTRYQLMVMDHAKHADMHGWGYAIFTPDGKAMSTEDSAARPEACNACHEMVPERGYVFSEPAYLHVTMPGTSPPPRARPAGQMDMFQSALRLKQLRFATEDAGGLPDAIRERLPFETGKVRVIHGAMEKYFFQGTANEMRPTLARETLTSGLPALLMNDKRNLFVLTYGDSQRPHCKLPGDKIGVRLLTFVLASGDPEGDQIQACAQPVGTKDTPGASKATERTEGAR